MNRRGFAVIYGGSIVLSYVIGIVQGHNPIWITYNLLNYFAWLVLVVSLAIFVFEKFPKFTCWISSHDWDWNEPRATRTCVRCDIPRSAVS